MKRNSGGEALLKKFKFNKNVIGAIITEDQAETTLSNIPIQENEKILPYHYPNHQLLQPLLVSYFNVFDNATINCMYKFVKL